MTTGVVLPDGRTWFIISVTGAPDWAGALVAGTMSANEGETTWTMQNTIYIDLEHQTRATVQASGTVLREQRLLGRFVNTYDASSGSPPLYDTNGVDLIYDTHSRIPLDLAQMAGTYEGLIIPYQEVAVTISATGDITGRTAFGCTFAGEAVPSGSVAEFTVTFHGPPCQQMGASAKGVLVVDITQGRLVSAGLSSDRNVVVLFNGIKR